MVRLEGYGISRRRNYCLFQFHDGAIRSESLALQALALLEFQFHDGAIRRAAGRENLPIFPEFQFHDGAIRRLLLVVSHHSTICFNSTMVRLEAIGDSISFRIITSFQFHDGAIRRRGKRKRTADHYQFQFHDGAIRSYAVVCFCGVESGFNSTMVRLEEKAEQYW